MERPRGEAASDAVRLLGLYEPGDLHPAQPLGIMRDLDLAALGVLKPERMIHELDQVAVGVLDVGVVLAAVLPASLLRVGTSDVAAGAGGRRPHVRDAEGGE